MYNDKDWNAPLSQQLKDLHSPNNVVVKNGGTAIATKICMTGQGKSDFGLETSSSKRKVLS